MPLGGGAHLHVFTLADGMLLGMGSGLRQGAYVIVGGTGAWHGCSGSYASQQSPGAPSCPGRARFDLNLTESGS